MKFVALFSILIIALMLAGCTGVEKAGDEKAVPKEMSLVKEPVAAKPVQEVKPELSVEKPVEKTVVTSVVPLVENKTLTQDDRTVETVAKPSAQEELTDSLKELDDFSDDFYDTGSYIYELESSKYKVENIDIK